jgi:hypothetical protein
MMQDLPFVGLLPSLSWSPVRAKRCGMIDPDETYVAVVCVVVLVVLVAALNVWHYRDLKKRKLTRKQLDDELREDTFTWWP